MGCVTETRPSLLSPDGSVAAIKEIRDCGATASEVSVVYVLAADEDRTKLDDNDPVVAVDKGDVKLRWIGPRQLEVDLGTSRVFVQKVSVGDVMITYIGRPTYP